MHEICCVVCGFGVEFWNRGSFDRGVAMVCEVLLGLRVVWKTHSERDYYL